MTTPPKPWHDRWLVWWLVIWIVAMVWLVYVRHSYIQWFALGDTDDNMRIAQVRAWLGGQGWYDLRQYRLDPPRGFDIHWSRVVDLPLAGLILALRPLVGGILADKWAAAIAPMLPLGLALWAVMLTARRLVAPTAFALAAAILLVAPNPMAMWTPLRIDHHGWQLATLILGVAGLADPQRLRGGLVTGFATALSLAIGLELMPYLALAGAATALWWVADRGQAPRLLGYGAALAGGSAAGYALFASAANHLPVCDALSPVWLSATLGAGGLLVPIAALRLEQRWVRFAVMAAAGAALLSAFALAWPGCLGRPERVSPELDRIWLSHVREARPLIRHGWRVALPVAALPVMGMIGSLLAAWRARGTPQLPAWCAVAMMALVSGLLLFWQTRVGPAAQLLAVPGATALGWLVMLPLTRHRSPVVTVGGSLLAFFLVSGAFARIVVDRWPPAPVKPATKKVNRANRLCPTLAALGPIARLPAATILTFNDLGPRLIAVTHHRAISGPYHRNGRAILDTQYSFRSANPEVAHVVMRDHGATLLLVCPGLSESTVYAAENPKGFYRQLMQGRVPGWLVSVPLPKGSPYRLWRLAD